MVVFRSWSSDPFRPAVLRYIPPSYRMSSDQKIPLFQDGHQPIKNGKTFSGIITLIITMSLLVCLHNRYDTNRRITWYSQTVKVDCQGVTLEWAPPEDWTCGNWRLAKHAQLICTEESPEKTSWQRFNFTLASTEQFLLLAFDALDSY